MVLEDVCFPPDRIAEGARDLQALLSKHGFLPGVAGHAAYGNLHFTLTPELADPSDRDKYAAFMADLVTLVIDKYDGSLKAEHGTGINMAPFVRHEWGDKATDMMWRIKKLADPHGVLAPNVVLTSDDGIHLKSFKSTPPIEDVATHCIECGFCEAACPSRNITTTPRQRIVLRREMARQPEGSPLLARLQDEYEYDSIETCAADGTCAIPCPVRINTGALMKTFRQAESTPQREKAALMIAQQWATGEKLARTAMTAADIVQRTIGVRALTGLTAAARLAFSEDLVPSVPGPMPRAQLRKLPSTTREGAAAVYFPACVNRIFGRDPGQSRHPSLPQALVEVSARAGNPQGLAGASRASAAPPRGAARATAGDTNGWPPPPAMRCGSGAGTARCRWSSTRPPAPAGCWTTSGTTSTRSTAPASSRSRCWTPSHGATACSLRSPSPGASNAPQSTRPAPPPTWG